MVVDTNVLVYTVNRDCPEHEVARGWVEEFRRRPSPWFLTWGIIYEFLRVSTHRLVLPDPLDGEGAWGFIEALMASPSLEILVPSPRHPQALIDVVDGTPSLSGNLFHDAHTVVLMREHGVRQILTRDLGFHRFGGIEVVDPMGS